jgi:hypothetical protein
MAERISEIDARLHAHRSRIDRSRSAAMVDGAEWIEHVRRWYFAGKQSSASVAGTNGAVAGNEDDALGYEAADPVLQAQHWPDAPLAADAPSAAIVGG